VGRHRAAPSCPLAAQNSVGSKDLSQSCGFTLVEADHSGIRIEQFNEHGLGPFKNRPCTGLAGYLCEPDHVELAFRGLRSALSLSHSTLTLPTPSYNARPKTHRLGWLPCVNLITAPLEPFMCIPSSDAATEFPN
jgi:hypothetical protein